MYFEYVFFHSNTQPYSNMTFCNDELFHDASGQSGDFFASPQHFTILRFDKLYDSSKWSVSFTIAYVHIVNYCVVFEAHSSKKFRQVKIRSSAKVINSHCCFDVPDLSPK